MKRRILSLLLAMCLVVGLMPMIAMAEDTEETTSTLTVASGNHDAPVKWNPTMAEGMTPVYAKTVDGGIVTEGASESDYNLKAEWSIGGKPTLTLKNATINNDNHHRSDADPSKLDTITIGGTADFVIEVVGTNTLNCYPANSASPVYTVSAYRCPYGIAAKNTGDLTIRGTDKATDQLAIHSWGGNGVDKKYGALTIENTDFSIKLYKDSTASSHAAHALLLQYTSAGYEDETNLTVRNSNFSINAGTNHAAYAIVLGKTNDACDATNTGDILFQNSVVNFNRSNSTGQSTALIQMGAKATITFDRCDVTSYAWRVVFDYIPTVTNYATATYREEVSSSSYTDHDYDPAVAGTTMKVRKVTATHACLAGEPVVLKTSECSTNKTTVTYCTICGKETGRNSDTIEASKAHTPGSVKQISKTNAKTANVDGSYVMEYACEYCDYTWQETKTFGLASLYYIESGTQTNTRISTSTNWTMKKTMNPGDATLYFTTGQYDTSETYANNWYVRYESEFTEADAWNMKLEYPEYGTPVLTLRNAKIINNMGLWFGLGKNRTSAPVTIVLEGTNYIENPAWSYMPSLGLHTSGGTTITGNGSLYIESSMGDKRPIVDARSSLTLDNTTVRVHKDADNSSNSASCDGIELTSGTLTVNGGSLMVTGHYTTTSNYRTYEYGITVPNMVVKNGANVTFAGGLSGYTDTSYGINVTGTLTVSESTLISSHGGYAYGNAVKAGTLALDFANGFTAGFSSTKFSYDSENDAYTFPTPTEAKTYTDLETLVANMPVGSSSNDYDYYMEIKPVAAVEMFEGTSVTLKEDLDINFKYDPAKLATAETVKYTIDGVEYSDSLANLREIDGEDTFIVIPGLNAKQMATEITVAIYDAEGKQLTEKKTDSVLAYALRQLRSETYADDTNEKNVNFKTLLVDMLIYGSMAQVQYCEYTMEEPLPYTALATSALTATEWDYASELKALDKENSAAVVDGTGYNATAFDLKKDIGMAVRLDAAVGATKATVTFTKYNEDEETTYDAVLESTDENYIVFVFENMSASNGRQDITWTFKDANDNVTLTVTDSLANYVARMVDDCPYLEKLVKYCDSARTYFLDPIV